MAIQQLRYAATPPVLSISRSRQIHTRANLQPLSRIRSKVEVKYVAPFLHSSYSLNLTTGARVEHVFD